MTRACWQWTNSFDCVDLDPRSDCSQPRFGQCAVLGPRSCIDQDTFFSPPVCTAWRTDFQCQTRGPVYDTVADCGTQQFCTEGTCWDTGHPPDTDFARTVTLLEAQREAGKYLDVNALRVFKGFDNRCDKKLFGLGQLLQPRRYRCLGTLQQSVADSLGQRFVGAGGVFQLHVRRAVHLRRAQSGGERLRGSVWHRLRFRTRRDTGRRPLGRRFRDLTCPRTVDAGDAGHPVLRIAVVSATATSHRHEARYPAVQGPGRVLLAASADHSHLPHPDAHVLLLQLAAGAAHQRARAHPTAAAVGGRRSSPTAAASP